MDWHSIEGYRLLIQAYPLRFLSTRGVFTVGGWMTVAVTANYVDFYLPEGPGRAPACFRHYFDHDPRRQHSKTTPLDLGELLPLPDPADPATWACLLADLWQARRGAGLPCGLALDPPSNYGEPWNLSAGIVGSGGLCFLELPVLYGDKDWWRDEKHHYPEYTEATTDPTLPVVLARIHYRIRRT